jgi:flagellar hook-associated protein 3 FlgL
MAIGTTRFFQNNSELFSRLNDDLRSLQVQAGSGKASLKLSESFHDVAKLNAAEEMKSKSSQYILNSKRAQSDLQVLDLAMERMQDLLVKLQEISVESSNDVLLPEERQRFIQEVKMIKLEMLDVGNLTDSFGNKLFSGISEKDEPFEIQGNGRVVYTGANIEKRIPVSDSLSVKQNFAGSDVFFAKNELGQNFSIFDLADDISESLTLDLNSGISSNLFSSSKSIILQFPDTEAKANVTFSFVTDLGPVTFSEQIFGNDYSALVDKINAKTDESGLEATLDARNRILINGSGGDLYIENFEIIGAITKQPTLQIVDPLTGNETEALSQQKLNHSDISLRITDAFEHISTKRAEVSANSRRAMGAEDIQTSLLVNLEEDIANIEDADLATILTRIELLMVQKDAAQATFTRITSKSLFDFLG